MSGAAPSSYYCPITSELMADPVSTADGFSYEREAIAEWLAGGHQSSPMTGARLSRADLLPNHALHSAIQEFISEHPEAASNLYRPCGVERIRSAIGAKTWASPQEDTSAADSMPQMGAPVEEDGAGPPPPMGAPPTFTYSIGGLSAADVAEAEPLAVPDWLSFCNARKGAKSGGGWFSSSSKQPAAEPDEPVIRARVATGGGRYKNGQVILDIVVSSDAQLCRLAMRLSAPSTAPVAILRIAAPDGLGPGMLGSLVAGGPGFDRLVRALHAKSGAAALSELREIAFNKITLKNDEAGAFAAALGGRVALESIELWNCGVEDDGALHVAALGAPASAAFCPALERLALGRNLISGHARGRMEALVDRNKIDARFN